MKEILLAALSLLLAGSVIAQNQSTALDAETQKALTEMRAKKPMLGIKAGYNIARLAGKNPTFSPDAKNGFMVSGFYSPANRGGLGYRSEIVFSRQGFEFDENGKNSSVTNDYLYLPQFTTIGITRYLQLQVGGQVGYLLKSSKEQTGSGSEDISSFTNRLDYGAAFGAELYPVKNLIIGGRYNFSFGNPYKKLSPTPSFPSPLPFNPSEVKTRNAVINFYIGFQF